MRGANIFVVYSSEKGDNVTLSPRLGKGHIMPEHDDEVGAAQVSLLEGSGVKDGIMTANVRCTCYPSSSSPSSLPRSLRVITGRMRPWGPTPYDGTIS